MTKSYLIIGDFTSEIVLNKIKSITNNQINYQIKPIDDKITPDMIAKYCEYFTLKSQDEINVGVIYNFDLISEISQNKLLKTIEENMNNTFHIFLAKTTNSILETIFSRVMLIDYSHGFISRDDFYDQYLKSISLFDEYKANESYKNKLIKVQELISNLDFDKLITYIYVNVDAKDKEIHTLIYLVIINTLNEKNLYQISSKLIDFENRFENASPRLQLLNVILKVKKEYNACKK